MFARGNSVDDLEILAEKRVVAAGRLLDTVAEDAAGANRRGFVRPTTLVTSLLALTTKSSELKNAIANCVADSELIDTLWLAVEITTNGALDSQRAQPDTGAAMLDRCLGSMVENAPSW